MQQFTKKEIKLSMLRLLESIPLDNIKVKTIIDDCGISRNTFYYYYCDIYDVLKDIFDGSVSAIVEKSPEEFSWEYVFESIANSVLVNKNIITNVFSSKYIEQITAYIDNVLGEFIAKIIKERYVKYCNEELNADITVISTFYKHAVTGTFYEWIHKGIKTDPKEFIKKLGKIFPNNLEESLKVLYQN